ncbi:MAG: GIY-YIG nuclease family protein [Bacillota bacterium]
MERERRKELVQQYREVGPEAGAYQIRNTRNNKVFIGTTPNLKTLTGLHMSLDIGMHPNHQLQREWKEYGQDAFVFEVLEVLKKKDEQSLDPRDELKQLERKWLEQLQPYGERGYHRP